MESKSTWPGWARNAIRSGLKQLERIERFVDLTTQGLDMVARHPELLEILESEPAHLAHAQLRAADVKGEMEAGFPLLHGQATLLMWSALEGMVRDLAIDWITNERSVLKSQALRKIRGPLPEYELLDPAERISFLVREIDRQAEAPQQTGVARFERLLNPLGLAGTVDAPLRRDLQEMHHVRNALAHSSMVVDGKLASACPWLDLTIGDPLHVSPESFRVYSRASMAYLVTLINRVRVKFAMEPITVSLPPDPRSHGPTLTLTPPDGSAP